MIILNVKGGIGNQIIQISYALNFSQSNKIFFIDSTKGLFKTPRNFYFASILNFKIPFSVQFIKLLRFLPFKLLNIISDNNLSNTYSINSNKSYQINLIDGYFQDTIYNHNFSWFKFKKIDLHTMFSLKKEKIIIAIHVRKGDYLNNTNNKIYCDIEFEYYEKSINYFDNKFLNPVFLIFSDDFNYVRSRFLGEKFILYNNSGNDLIDHNHMSSCDHFIIANSTFSYTAAMIGSTLTSIKVAPYNWYYNKMRPNLFTEEWISF